MGLRDRLKLGKDVQREKTDRVGGVQIHPSDFYVAKVKALYLTETKNGATMANVILEMPDGSEYKEMQCVARMVDGESSATYTKDGRQYPLPGFDMIDDLLQLAADESLEDADTEDKYVKVYNNDTKREEDTEVDFYTQVIDKEIGVVLKHVKKNKYKGGKEINEAIETNEISKFVDPEERATVAELIADSEEDADEPTAGTYVDKWLDKYKGQIFDTYKEVSEGRGARAGGKSLRRNKADDSTDDSAAAEEAPRKKRLLGRNK